MSQLWSGRPRNTLTASCSRDQAPPPLFLRPRERLEISLSCTFPTNSVSSLSRTEEVGPPDCRLAFRCCSSALEKAQRALSSSSFRSLASVDVFMRSIIFNIQLFLLLSLLLQQKISGRGGNPAEQLSYHSETNTTRQILPGVHFWWGRNGVRIQSRQLHLLWRWHKDILRKPERNRSIPTGCERDSKWHRLLQYKGTGLCRYRQGEEPQVPGRVPE